MWNWLHSILANLGHTHHPFLWIPQWVHVPPSTPRLFFFFFLQYLLSVFPTADTNTILQINVIYRQHIPHPKLSTTCILPNSFVWLPFTLSCTVSPFPTIIFYHTIPAFRIRLSNKSPNAREFIYFSCE